MVMDATVNVNRKKVSSAKEEVQLRKTPVDLQLAQSVSSLR